MGPHNPEKDLRDENLCVGFSQEVGFMDEERSMLLCRKKKRWRRRAQQGRKMAGKTEPHPMRSNARWTCKEPWSRTPASRPPASKSPGELLKPSIFLPPLTGGFGSWGEWWGQGEAFLEALPWWWYACYEPGNHRAEDPREPVGVSYISSGKTRIWALWLQRLGCLVS